ncbi:MAG: PQQ-like beta-propeller repeat protein [Bacteroidaceae bacterium]|nr:PQQ-like beta-propeller repeat protein [Bacteroidaceae bacterium]
MKNKNRIITIVTILIWTAVLVGWHLYDPSTTFTEFVPGADKRPPGSERKADDVVIGEFFMADVNQNGDKTNESSSGTSQKTVSDTSLHDAWPGFRGPDRTNIVSHSTPMQLAESDFKEMWSVETGEGHAAPAVWQGRVYVLDYNEQLSSDALRCFDLRTGVELWRRWYRVPMKRNHGFSRTIPAITSDGLVVTIGPEGHVMCCNGTNGNLQWTMDLKRRFSTEVPFWYAGQCPLISGNELVLAPAGTDTLMVGIDVTTGQILWATPNEKKLKMSHSSVMPMTLGGKSMLVYAGIGGVCGVSADGSDKGKMLWFADAWQPSVIAPSPLQLNDSQIFLVAGYGAGGGLLQVNKSSNGWQAKILDQYKADKGMSSEQQTPILYRGNIITILPKDGGGMRERVSIYQPRDLHRAVWNSASDERFGLGPYIVIDGRLFALKEDGQLFVYEIGDKSMTLLRKQTVIEDGADAWGPMAYADGMLLLRDAKNVKCFKIDQN